jgi:hypothetical protein
MADSIPGICDRCQSPASIEVRNVRIFCEVTNGWGVKTRTKTNTAQTFGPLCTACIGELREAVRVTVEAFHQEAEAEEPK